VIQVDTVVKKHSQKLVEARRQASWVGAVFVMFSLFSVDPRCAWPRSPRALRRVFSNGVHRVFGGAASGISTRGVASVAPAFDVHGLANMPAVTFRSEAEEATYAGG
jgi:hypothetical protein